MTVKHPWHESHPFLSFEYRMDRIPESSWAMLGECSSKIEHVLGTPLRREVAEQMNQVFLAKGAHGTTAIEGNTLSEDQVKGRVKGTLKLPPTQEYLGREVDNVVEGYNYLIQQLDDGVPHHFSAEDLRTLNRIVLKDLPVEDGVVPGEFRQGYVVVGDYRSPSAEYVRQMVDEGCRWLNQDVWKERYAGPFILPILRAILSHLYIAWIHPFGDGNGRTARLVEFDLLIRAGVPLASAHLLSDYYNRTRANYYRALSAARQTPTNFVAYAVEGLRDMLREQIGLIRAQQLDVTWENYIYLTFRKQEESKTAKRQREVALVLGAKKQTFPTDAIPGLSPKLAGLYGKLTRRTLVRDLRDLAAKGLVVYEKGHARANLDVVQAFLPAKGAARPVEPTPEGPVVVV